jgi:hypothetical protein
MRRVLSVASIMLIGLAAISSAQADIIRFKATLVPWKENPPVVSDGFGFVFVDYDDVAHTLLVQASWDNLTGTTTVAHIHCCTPPSANAGVAVTPGTLPGFPVGLTSGNYTSPLLDLTLVGTYTPGFIANFAGGNVANAEGVLISNMMAGMAYFNIHSSFAPGGEIRGAPRASEPGSLALLGLGLLALVGVRRRGYR